MRRLVIIIGCALLLAACGSAGAHGARDTPAAAGPDRSATAARPHTPQAAPQPLPAAPLPTPTPTPRPGSAAPRPAPTQLPRGGRAILGHYRVVAYYGAPGTGALGVLGRGTPDHAARSVTQRAKGFVSFGLPVQPAMELISTVAQGLPGPDGSYSAAVPHAEIERYLAAAHRHKMLLILDLQPGRASFLSQAESLRPFLRDPSVGLGLDPEWKVYGNQVPGGGRIGSSGARGINAVIDYVHRIVAANGLPDKLLVVHQFTASMLPDRDRIKPARGVEVSLHADGFGTPAEKSSVFSGLNFPPRPFGVGFKLFLTQDSRLMTPSEVMRLHRRPDIITYQ